MRVDEGEDKGKYQMGCPGENREEDHGKSGQLTSLTAERQMCKGVDYWEKPGRFMVSHS